MNSSKPLLQVRSPMADARPPRDDPGGSGHARISLAAGILPTYYLSSPTQLQHALSSNCISTALKAIHLL